MTKRWARAVFAAAAIIVGLWHGPAHAAYRFGAEENIRFVANVTLQGPNGEKLYLARKLTTKSFLLPYTIHDDGFVLGVSGKVGGYYRMPEGADLKRFQDGGFLPEPLPDYKIGTLDLLFGHLLWAILLVIAVIGVIGYLRHQQTPAAQMPSSSGDARPLPLGTAQYAAQSIDLPQTLYPSRLKFALLAFISLVFVAIGFLVRNDGNPTAAYLLMAIFGLGFVVSIIQLIPGSASLTLDRDGFTTSSLFKKSTIRWHDIARFGVARIRRRKMVTLHYDRGYVGQETSRSIARQLTGAEGALPDTYGLKAEDLADLMNEIKHRLTNGRL